MATIDIFSTTHHIGSDTYDVIPEEEKGKRSDIHAWPTEL